MPQITFPGLGEKKHCVSSKLTALNKYVLIQKQKDHG